MTVQQIAGRVAPPLALPAEPGPAPPLRGPAFAEVLGRAAGPRGVAFSAHASDRLGERGIEISDALHQRLAEAIDTLDAKGARDAVLLGSDAAFVVNVPNRTVVTALSPSDLRDRAVTQIDSALLL